ncbi:MAG: sugar ABC transporter permease [Chloroflexia bacterium]|nr:sugar ABC transporter permease [Chloroflexia bacterium]MDQ3411106.1 sugar ABC transporter permease [Chloroflexota bacterium]
MTTRAETMTATAVDRALEGQRRRRLPWLLPYLLALPIIAYEGVFILYPIYQGLRSSFFRQQIGMPEEWAGLANYERLLGDTAFWGVMGTTIIYMVAVIAAAIGVGLGSALVLNRAFRGRTLARAMMTMPWSFPDVPTVLVFLWILNPSFGVINVFARLLPWIEENPTWLLDPRLAFVSVVGITAWKGFPFYSLVILAALQTVPSELLEAAKIDGASPRQAFFAVTLPAISPTLLLLTVLAAIFSFKQFTLIWLLTGGGPSGATETIVVRIYSTAFRFYDFSYAAALGVAGFLLALTVSLVFLAVQRRQDMEAG